MWSFYIIAALLTAIVTLKVVHPLMGRGPHHHTDKLTQGDKRLTYSLVLLVPVLALALYLPLGRPDVESAPSVFTQYRELGPRHLSLLAQRPAERLFTENPEDVGALTSLAGINRSIGDYNSSVLLYKKALESAQKQKDWRTRIIANVLGEVQVEANGGNVGADARETFNYVLTLHDKNPIARYFLALGRAQDGELQAALDEWTALLNEHPGDAYWKERLREKAAQVRGQLRAQARQAAETQQLEKE